MRIPIGPWTLRRFDPGDVEALVRHGDNRRVWLGLLDLFPHPYTRDKAREWISKVGDEEPVRHFAIATPQELIGCVGLELQKDVFFKTAELGYWLGEAFWGQGIATRAARAVTAYGFETFDLERISAHVFESNPGSARVLEKAGFTLEGRLRRAATKAGRTMDLSVYAILRSEVLPGAEPS